MSPSLDSSDNHGGHSNTFTASKGERFHHYPSDALPMLITSNFEFTDAACGQRSLSSPLREPLMCAAPQPTTRRAKLAFPLARSVLSERQGGLTTSLAGERTTRAATGIGPFSNKLAVPAPAYGRVESPFNMSRSSSFDDNSQNDLGIVDAHSALHAAFLLTRSRAVKVRKHPSATFMALRSIFEFLDETHQTDPSGVGTSLSMWTLKDLSAPDDVWVVFKSHRDAYIFLSLSLPSFTILPVLEADLEPFEKFRRVDVFSRFPPLPVIQPERKSHRLRMSISTPDFHNRIHVGYPSVETPNSSPVQAENFVISSNPPNPRTTFRVGDWICNSVTCSAHNFGRNLTCRGCGCPRSESQASSMNRQAIGMHSTRFPTSPRIVSTAGTPPFYTGSPIPNTPVYAAIQQGACYPLAAQAATNAKSASPSHPLLTPSGRSFSVGGKVQNVSVDPAVPCIMYWPDNEPLPEQGQIRPSNLAGVPQPPILNTGNRGPIEHQPGDWICQKCNYLNWRRRKVCQTCYPYAEGNGDSISAAVQSERINLLTSLLAQNQLPFTTTPSTFDVPRRSTMAQVQQRPPEAVAASSRPCRSQIDLRATTQYPDPQFIYETSGPHRYGSPSFPGMRELENALPANAPVPLLPSFLQDIVQSPTLSPTSSSSADLSIEEYEDISSSPRACREQVVSRDESTSNYPFGNIWRLNDEETTNIAGIALPHHENLIGSRKGSQEILRRQSP